MSEMDPRCKKLIELLGYEQDACAWKDVFSSIFNGVDYSQLHKVADNADQRIYTLLSQPNQGHIGSQATVRILSRDAIIKAGGDDAFRIDANGVVNVLEDVVLPSTDHASDLITLGSMQIGDVPVYLGKGASLQRVSITTPSYISQEATVMRVNLCSNTQIKNRLDVPVKPRGCCYIGRGATAEDARHLEGVVIGSGISSPVNGYPTAYFHGDTAIRLLVGGSSAISAGVSHQSHQTGSPTVLMAPNGERIYLEQNGIDARSASRTPGFIGVDCLMGDGAHLANPFIIAQGSVVKSKDGSRPFISGLVMKDGYTPAREYRNPV